MGKHTYVHTHTYTFIRTHALAIGNCPHFIGQEVPGVAVLQRPLAGSTYQLACICLFVMTASSVMCDV